MSRYPLNLPTQLKKEAELFATQQGISLNQFIMWSVAEKVGALSQKLDDPEYPQVTYRRGTAGIPTPILRGTGVRVQTVVIANKSWELSTEEIASNYSLSKSQVKEAMSFYDAHKTEIDTSIEAEESMEPVYD